MKQKLFAVAGLSAVFMASQGISQDRIRPDLKMNPDGSINVPAFVLPFSIYASPEAQQDIAHKLSLSEALEPGRTSKDINVRRQNTDKVLFQPWADAQWKRYPDIKMTEESIAGIGVQIFVPKAGVSAKNKDRVLINLHGGGFAVGWGVSTQLESIPIASLGRIKVISVNYRMYPEARFPAASEDVEKVYRELLKAYKPSQIGIYGCSAGGILTGQAIAWFQKVRLPNPAAIGILGGSTTGLSGDSMYVTGRLGGIIPAPAGNPKMMLTSGYFEGANEGDPLVTPSSSSAVLAKFPPTLLLTGTRAGDMSAMTRTHLDLTRAGVDARMYLWDGLDHCFTYNPEIPESREAYDMTVKFFDQMMDKAQKPSR